MEYVRRCNVCGHIWCFTDNDMEKNKKNVQISLISSIGSLANVIGGTRYDAYEQSKIANKILDKIADYSKCPNCNSTNTKMISKEEYDKIQKIEEKRRNGFTANATLESLKKRIELFIEEKDWDSASLYLEQITDMSPDNAMVYMLGLFVEYHATNDVDLINICSKNKIILDNNKNFRYVKKFGDQNLINRINEINKKIKEQIEKDNVKAFEDKYINTINIAKNSYDLSELMNTLEILESFEDYKEAREECGKLSEKIEKLKKEELEKEEKKRKQKIEKIKKYSKKIIIAIIILIVIVIVIVIVSKLIISLINKNNLYNKAMSYYENKNYEEAIEVLESIPKYKDSDEKIEECKEIIKELEEKNNKEEYEKATNMLDNGETFEAYKIFLKLGDYSNSKTMAEESLIQCWINDIRIDPSEVNDYKSLNKAVKETLR